MLTEPYMNKQPLPTRSQQPKFPPATAGFALWDLGFRPFYLLAGLYSIFSVLFWAAAFSLYVLRYWSVLTRPRLDGKPI